MKILVTGSDGFIGKNLVDEFQKEGFDIITPLFSEGFDITKSESFEDLQAVDAVVHLAAIASVPRSWKDPEDVLKVNINGTLNLLEGYCIKYKPFLIYAGSYLYGVPEKMPIDEEAKISCLSPYAVSKFAAEQLCFSYAKNCGFKCASIRAFNPYGPYQPVDLVISKIITQLITGQSIRILDGKPKRDFIYVRDLTRAYVDLIKSGDEGIYNVGSGESYSIKEIAQMIIKISGITKAGIVDEGRERSNDIPETRADITKINKTLGWKPEVGIEEGLRRTYEWFKERK